MVKNDTRVEDYMNKNVIVVNENETIEAVERKMLKHQLDGFPVVDDNCRIVGMINVMDLFFKHPKMKIKKLMVTGVVSVQGDMKIEYAARIMFRKGISRVPVVENKKIIGIFTHTDVLRAHIERVTPTKVEKIKESFEKIYNIKFTTETNDVYVEKLIPSQNRIVPDELEGRKYELRKGLAEPIVVVKSSGGFVIADGHHRGVAAHKLGIEKINAYILIPDRDIKLGLEKEAERLNLKTVEDIKIIDEYR
ncbi:MAG: hypothetical protein CVT90_03045 [Candidatus Altiarchaeales archaeon HGW-Altiarchaeales-3]|nr:MAG: hypothetical protein CVT90_03045 [Candidatus Altiarchaeales archaeon HGW-Altiarchaeales-3]